MGDTANTMFDDGSQVRPLGLSLDSDSETIKNKAVDNLTKSNSRNAESKDDTQHMKKMRNELLLLAGTTSLVNRHNRKVYERFTKNINHLEEDIKAEKNKPGATGIQGRSISEVFAENKLAEEKKKFEKFQKKHPNLQRPQSMSDRVKQSTRTIFSGLKEATRAQSMKGISEAQSGSDIRAMQAAAVAGSIPGAQLQSDEISL